MRVTHVVVVFVIVAAMAIVASAAFGPLAFSAYTTPLADVVGSKIKQLKVTDELGEEIPTRGLRINAEAQCADGTTAEKTVSFHSVRMEYWEGPELSLEVFQGRIFVAHYEANLANSHLQKRYFKLVGKVENGRVIFSPWVKAQVVFTRLDNPGLAGSAAALMDSFNTSETQDSACVMGVLGSAVEPRLVISFKEGGRKNFRDWDYGYLPNPLSENDYILEGSLHSAPAWKKTTPVR